MLQKLSRDENKLLELYSLNYTYEQIQEEMHRFSEQDYKGKRLNHAMSELRKKLKHNTQFAMGHQYAIKSMGLEHPNDINFIDIHNKHKGINIGIAFATIFWIIIISIIYFINH